LSRQIETDILNFSQKGKSDSGALKELLRKWRTKGLSPSDANIIGHFLFSISAIDDLIFFSVESIEKDEPVSWFYLGKALKIIEPNLNAPIYIALKGYISDYRKLDEFTSSDLFDSLYPHEGEVKLSQIQAKIQIKERHRQTLLDQIRLFNQSRNFNIEKQAIQKFIKFYPKDKTGREHLQRFETEEVQRFYQRYRNERQRQWRPLPSAFSSDEESWLESHFKSFSQHIKSTSSEKNESFELLGYAYFFIFAEDFLRALKLVEIMPSSESRDWLHLDLLIFNNKFAEALAYFKYLDQFYSQSPSYFPAKVYYTAQCFWGLGDRRKAIELMDSLFQVKPDYRLTSSLLKDWRSEP
jgi:hypothetical protein